nr:MAG TPA: hypothetical protein [Caudoviricetes sp.]
MYLFIERGYSPTFLTIINMHIFLSCSTIDCTTGTPFLISSEQFKPLRYPLPV